MYPWKINACSQYGSSIGRRQDFADLTGRKLHLRRVRLDRGGYDPAGAYWGIGAPLYCAYDDDGEIERYTRAGSREGAKRAFPGARWYR